jgi:hypothetical protein
MYNIHYRENAISRCFEKDESRINIDSRIDVSQKFDTLLYLNFCARKRSSTPNQITIYLSISRGIIFMRTLIASTSKKQG